MTTPFPATNDYLTLADIDAALATFADPLAPDEVVALAQWWTLRHFRVDLALLFLHDWNMLIQCGYQRDAVYYARLETELQHGLYELLRLYSILPMRDEHLLCQIYASLEQSEELEDEACDDLIQIELAAGHYEAAMAVGRYKAARADAQLVPDPDEVIVEEIFTTLVNVHEWAKLDDYLWTFITLEEQSLPNFAVFIWVADHLNELGFRERATAYLDEADKLYEQFSSGEKPLPIGDPNWDDGIDRYVNVLLRFGRIRDAFQIYMLMGDEYDWLLKSGPLEDGLKRIDDENEIIEYINFIMEYDELDVSLIVPLIERLLELGCHAAAREYFFQCFDLEQNLLGYFDLHTALNSPQENTALFERIRQHITTTTHPKSSARYQAWNRFCTRLIKVGHFHEAETIYAAHFRHPEFAFPDVMFHEEVINYFDNRGDFAGMIKQVELWRQFPTPVYLEPLEWTDIQYDVLIKSCRLIREFSPDYCSLWLAETASRLSLLQKKDHYEDRCAYVALEYFQNGDLAATLAWLFKSDADGIDYVARECIEPCLKRNDLPNALMFLRLLLQGRFKKYGAILWGRVDAVNAALAMDVQSDTAAPSSHRPPLAHDFGSVALQKLHDAEANRDSQFLPSFLNKLLGLSYTAEMQAHILRACLDVIASFAPAWADLLTETEGIPA